jgi:hypothetical protein
VAPWIMLAAVLVLVLAGAAASALVGGRNAQRRNKRVRGGSRTHLTPREPWQADPGFKVRRKNQDPGFSILSETGGHAARRPPRTKPAAIRPTGPGGFDYVVNVNPTAVCRLTGKQAGDCQCDIHKGKA